MQIMSKFLRLSEMSMMRYSSHDYGVIGFMKTIARVMIVFNAVHDLSLVSIDG
jgi:hypothetical protein